MRGRRPAVQQTVSSWDIPRSCSRRLTLTSVLLVEDEPALRDLIGRSLRDEGFSVAEARNGREALAALSSTATPFDVLVTDVRMPYLSGVELVHELRDRHLELRVLYITGYPSDDTDTELQLVKPFTRAQLMAAMRKLA